MTDTNANTNTYLEENYIGDIRPLLITYEASQTKDYLCLATFLSLCGVSVASRRRTQADVVGSELGCDAAIHFLEETCNQDTHGDVYITPAMTKEDGVLNVALKKLQLVGLISDSMYQLLFDIANDVYKKYDLRKAEYNGQYYFYIRSEAESSMDKYYKACTEVRILQKRYGEKNWVLWFIRGQFMRRIQTLADLMGRQEPYDISGYIRKLKELQSENPDNYMLYILMGNLAVTSVSTYDQAGDYYRMGLNLANKHQRVYLSDAYYKYGHWLEANKRDSEALSAFKISYELDRMNYRAIYKLALHLENKERDYDAAWHYYGEIQSILEDNRDAKCIQPFEYEYLFKVYYCKRNMIRDRKVLRTDRLRDFENCLMSMDQQKPEDAYFLQQFYGADYKRYFDYMIDRIAGFKKKLYVA